MKINVVVPSFPAISETFILNHISGLLDAGHQVTIFSIKKEPVAVTHDIVHKYELMKRTKYLKEIPSNKTACRLITLFYILVYIFRFPVKLIRTLAYLLFQDRVDFYDKLYFFFLIAGQKADIYHFHFGHIGLLGVFLRKSGFKERMITSFHGYDINIIPFSKENYYHKLFEIGDHFIANSAFTKQQMKTLGCPQDKITVIPVGLHIKDFPFKIRQYPLKGPIHILTIGRFVEKKGHEYSIRAIARLIKEGYNIHYTMGGSGMLRSKLEDLVRQLGIAKHVSFTGKVTQREVIDLYNQSHLFVLASVTASDGDKEGQGLVLQEAQACGLPVVSTLHNGIPEGVLDGRSGILVPEKDTDALAEAIRKLILNPSSWSQMGHAGREFIEEKYEMTLLIPQILCLYQQQIKQIPK